jgi:GAF domain-containing protein
VSIICGTPIALLTLIDEDRQWFKSRRGISQRETPRGISFCTHAIEQPELMIVEDALLDARFKDNPLVLGDPRVRFYAGAPLITPDGHALGTLCAVDRVPRTLDAAQREALSALARHAVVLLEQRQAMAALVEALERVRKLEGLLPICSFCHQIRDEAGDWKRLEAYISERSGASFTHGICHACVERNFPDYRR